MTTIELKAGIVKYLEQEGRDCFPMDGWDYETLRLVAENTSRGDMYKVIIHHNDLGYYGYNFYISCDDAENWSNSLYDFADDDILVLTHLVKLPVYRVSYEYVTLEEAEARGEN